MYFWVSHSIYPSVGWKSMNNMSQKSDVLLFILGMKLNCTEGYLLATIYICTVLISQMGTDDFIFKFEKLVEMSQCLLFVQ